MKATDSGRIPWRLASADCVRIDTPSRGTLRGPESEHDAIVPAGQLTQSIELDHLDHHYRIGDIE